MNNVDEQVKSYEGVWKVLSDLILTIRKRGLDIPSQIMVDLRSAKVMINILKTDPSVSANITPQIETYLGNVEGNLVYLAIQKFGDQFIEKWMEKLDKARRGELKIKIPDARIKFVPGLPRDSHWIRIRISELTPIKKIEELAADANVSTELQSDGYILVYGDDLDIKRFVKKMVEKAETS